MLKVFKATEREPIWLSLVYLWRYLQVLHFCLFPLDLLSINISFDFENCHCAFYRLRKMRLLVLELAILLLEFCVQSNFQLLWLKSICEWLELFFVMQVLDVV
jgi:hypothetical protein